MLIVYDQDRDLWDVYAGDVYFFSTHKKEQAEIVLETLDDGMTKIMNRKGVAPISDCGAWERGLYPAVDSFRAVLVRQALQMTKGNKSQAAKLLRIGRTTFIEIFNRMEKEYIELLA